MHVTWVEPFVGHDYADISLQFRYQTISVATTCPYKIIMHTKETTIMGDKGNVTRSFIFDGIVK